MKMIRQNNDLHSKAANATMWSMITSVICVVIPAVVNMVLARLLVPEAFGIVATFTMVISFADIFTDAGFQKYIVQHEYCNDKLLYSSANVAFWTNFILSIVIWLFITVQSNAIANLLDVPGYGSGITVACIVIPLTAFSSIQTAILRRQLNFKLLFWVRLSVSLVPLIVTIPLAIYIKSYWALVIGSVAKEIVNVVFLSVVSPYKVRLKYSIVELREMFSFSAWSLLEQVSIWLTVNIDIFLVGKLLDHYYLGIYKTSMATVNSLLTVFSAAVKPVLFATLSRLQSEPVQFSETYYKFQRLLAIVVLPLGVGCYVFRDLLTNIMLGSQWHDATEFIGLWGLALSVLIVYSYLNSEVIRSKGKPKLSLLVQCVQIVIIPIGIYTSSRYGFRAMYIVRSSLALFLVVSSVTITKVCFQIKVRPTITGTFPSVSASLFMGMCGILLKKINTSIAWQMLCVIICIAIYFTFLLIVFPKTRKEVYNVPFVKNVMNRFSKHVVNAK